MYFCPNDTLLDMHFVPNLSINDQKFEMVSVLLDKDARTQGCIHIDRDMRIGVIDVAYWNVP